MEQRKDQATDGVSDPVDKIQPMNDENGQNNAEEELPYGDDDMDVDGADGYGDD
jgi:hypothetical protein